ncbi:MAG: hypothetical protein CML23_06870 [Rhizobiaceae bacterium]|nr:hypothetical protein [Rhizobiaceae bacterium]|tara:strand:- start:2827 stop:3915 length:1089 start_codon:yes stop_codon:yes gene_type:complete
MKILMIMYARSVGGAELEFLELAEWLSKTHTVKIIAFGGDAAVKHAGVYGNIPCEVYSFGNSKFQIAKCFATALTRNIGEPADAIITTAFLPNVLSSILSRFNGAGTISLQTVSKTMRFPAIDRMTLRSLDALIAGSNDIRQYLLNHGQRDENIHVVNNWVDLLNRSPSRAIEETRQLLGLADDDVLIGCMGRFHHQKGQEFLIAAYLQLEQTHPNLRLMLVGGGEKEKEFKELASKAQREVIFPGLVKGEEYNNLFSAIDVYVQPSRFEGLPRTLVDAMYLKKPIVASAVNGNLDAISDNVNGLTVPAEDSEAIARAISELISNPSLASALSERAHNDAVEQFGMEVQMKKIEKIIDTIIA